MATYENGRVPRGILVTLDTGNGRHLTTVKCMVIWYALRAWVWATYQVWLEISPGMNAYRDIDEQAVGRRNACADGNCNAAAAPGWSSHGGNWAHPVHTGGRRVDAFAFDVGNWWLLSKDAWFDACRRFGIEPGLIDKSVAGVDEWWHVIIFDPFGPPPVFPAALTATPIHTPKEDNMSIQIRCKDTAGSIPGLIAQVGPGYFAAMPNMSSADVVRNVFSIEDERHQLTEGEFRAVTDSCGIPAAEVKPGNYWSQDKASYDKVAYLELKVNEIAAKP
ncbi:hypothetical protein CH252_19200 [Rhodococcus sp. 06-1477-1B]|nr:hypothetical protein CH252_19200 [Rhodococcus sp. 06-1477-1B]